MTGSHVTDLIGKIGSCIRGGGYVINFLFQKCRFDNLWCFRRRGGEISVDAVRRSKAEIWTSAVVGSDIYGFGFLMEQFHWFRFGVNLKEFID